MKEYFNDEHIIRLVAKNRAKKALLRGEFLFYRNISKTAPIFKKRFDIDKLCPPRKQWLRLSKHIRKSLSPIKSLELSIYLPIKKLYKSNITAEEDWVNNLKDLIFSIQQDCIENKTFTFSEPKIKPELKDEKTFTYRPISNFTFKEKIVASLTTKYLTNTFEILWKKTNSAYAFRSAERLLTHHTAVEDIIKYKSLNTKVYASECDIKKFFDSVNHEIAMNIFQRQIELLKKEGVFVDDSAVKIFRSYLDSYTFKETVLNKSKFWFEKFNISNSSAHFEWIEKELKDANLSEDVSIGVPQGGALSCFISNLILHEVDVIIKEKNDENLFYARYCDDMILLHVAKEKCQQYLNIYTEGLSKLNLFYHDNVAINNYNSSFWNSKSKLPYSWNNPIIEVGSVPWLSFVGYQIKHDGLLRVRPKSVKKEKIKQVKVIDSALRNLHIRNKTKAQNNLSIKTKQVVYRIRKKLLAMSIGVINIEGLKYGNKFCWIEGFKLLKGNDFITSQIRSLDRNRVRQIYRLKRHLEKLSDPEVKKSIKRIPFDNFDSYLLSYYKQLK